MTNQIELDNSADWREGRYLGREHRGPPTRAEENELDVRLAIRELEVAQAIYMTIDRETSDLDRRRLMVEAQERTAFAQRFLAAVLKRPAK